MFSLRDLQLLWSSGIPVSSYGMFLHFTYIVHRKVSFRTSHFHTVLLCFFLWSVLSCTECIFLPNSREGQSIEVYIRVYNAVVYIAVYIPGSVWIWEIPAQQKQKRTDGYCPFEVAKSSVIQISSVDFIKQRVLNLWLYISNKYNVQYRFYLYTIPSSFSFFFPLLFSHAKV